MGYQACVTKLAASSYGSPQSRTRYYIVMVYATTIPIHPFAQLQARVDTMARTCAMQTLSTILSDDADPNVIAWLASYKRGPPSTKLQWEEARCTQRCRNVLQLLAV